MSDYTDPEARVEALVSLLVGSQEGDWLSSEEIIADRESRE